MFNIESVPELLIGFVGNKSALSAEPDEIKTWRALLVPYAGNDLQSCAGGSMALPATSHPLQ